MEMNPTISGRNTISSPSQLCLQFTSILHLSVSTSVFILHENLERRRQGPQFHCPHLPPLQTSGSKRQSNNRSSLLQHPHATSWLLLLPNSQVGVGGAEDQWGKTFKGSKFCSSRTQCGGLAQKGYFIKPFSSLRSTSSFSPLSSASVEPPLD